MITETVRELIKLFRTIEPNTVLSNGTLTELSQLPAIVLSGPIAVEKKRLMRDAERITAVDIDNDTAVREVPPRWYDLRFNVSFSCASMLELVQLMEECSRLVQREPLLTAVNDDRTRQYSWAWREFPSAYNVPDISEVSEGRGELVIFDVEAYSGIQEIVPLIKVIDVDINEDNMQIKE